MIDLSHIPDEELAADLKDSEADLATCETALALGITHYLDGTRRTSERVDGNRRIITIIKEEMERRL